MKLNVRSLAAISGVTPCVGVRIETMCDISSFTLTVSHPAWVCGLKHVLFVFIVNTDKSHPAWVCGLKHDIL